MKGAPGRGIQVLLVEDEPAEAMLIQRLLRSCCPGMFNVTQVQTMKKARQELQGTNFQVVLLDLNLPDSAPMETITLGGTGIRNIPVVIMSGRDDLKKLAKDMNMPYFLTKGDFDSAKLTRTLLKAMADAGQGSLSADCATCSADSLDRATDAGG